MFSNIQNHKQKAVILLFLILLLAAIFRFWGLPGADIQHDNALNSVRAIGWFDFLTGENQTSPIIWFGHIPWWGGLSFHDHPPLVFLIQNIFLTIFGQSSLATLLSFALAGISTAYLLYFLLARIRSKSEGLLAALFFTVSSYSIWIARTGFLEGIEILFITASFLFFTLYLYKDNKKYLFYWSIFTALAILSKYTAIFLLPAVAVYLMIWQRKIFKNKNFYLALFAMLILLLPIIIYNIMVYQTRGHFDAALSSMLGMHPQDYSVLTREVSFGVGRNFLSIFGALYENTSLPFLVLQLSSLLYLLWQVARKQADKLQNLLLINLVMLFAMFSFGSAGTRFLTIILPFLCLNLAIMASELWRRINAKKIWKKIAATALITIIFFEFFYSVNTNLLAAPLGAEKIAYAPARFYNYGFAKLDQYLRQNAYGKLPNKRKITLLDEQTLNYHYAGREVILFDDRADWNMRMWYLHRYQTYYNVPIIYISDILAEIEDGSQIFNYLLQGGATGFWLITAQGSGLRRTDLQNYDNLIRSITAELYSLGVTPIKTITDYQGNTSFEIYHFFPK